MAPAARASAAVRWGARALNYRHHFHAGNFADVHKHAILLQVLSGLTAAPGRLEVLDTHAGAGVHDLQGEAARRSREAEAGIGRLLAEASVPPPFNPLASAVAALNRGGEVRLYPGSPLLIIGALRPGDAYVGCELRADDAEALRQSVQRVSAPGVEVIVEQADGFSLAGGLSPSEARTLLLIDPPYERGDDYARIVETLGAALKARPRVAALLWAPIKDLETYDALLRRLETLSFREGWTAEARLRPLDHPLRLNGSSLIGLGLPPPPELAAISAWVTASGGEPGAAARVSRLSL